jgi:hypothetical protein
VKAVQSRCSKEATDAVDLARSSCAKYSSSRAVLRSTNVERIHASNAATFLLVALAPA